MEVTQEMSTVQKGCALHSIQPGGGNRQPMFIEVRKDGLENKTGNS